MGPREKLLSLGCTDVRSPETAYPIPYSHTSRPTERHLEKREGVAMQGETLGWQEERL